MLKELERKFERLFEGFFARHFRSSLQPIELAKSLVKEQDKKKTAGITGFYVPNRYLFSVSETDFPKIQSLTPSLIKELEQFLIKRAKVERYTFAGSPKVEIRPKEGLAEGEFELESEVRAEEGWEMPSVIEQTHVFTQKEAASVAATGKAVLVPLGEGNPFVVDKAVTTVGRRKENDLVIPDPSISRYHARIERGEEGYLLEDLGSTNGTVVNHKKLGKHGKWTLKDGDLVAFAEMKFRFRGE